MWVGWIEFDLIIDQSGSLKEKRGVVRPLIAELRRRFQVSAAEVGHLDLHRRTAVGVALTSADRAHLVEVLDSCERFVAGRFELQLVRAERVLRRSDD